MKNNLNQELTMRKSLTRVAMCSVLMTCITFAALYLYRSRLVELKKRILPSDPVPQLDNKNLFKAYRPEISIKSKDDASYKRSRLKEILLSKNSYTLEVRRGKERSDCQLDSEGFECYQLAFIEENGVSSNAFLISHKKRSRDLVIYHEGHDGHSLDREKEFIKRLMLEGYDIMLFDMPLIGKNPTPNTLPIVARDPHGSLRLLESRNRHLISFFVTPVVMGIDFAKEKRAYKTVSMVGISGGGWTTVLSAAIDERIDVAFSIAGSLPLELRTYDMGDSEQIHTSFYKEFPYLDLYTLGSVAENGKYREFYQIFFDRDPCCFSGNRAQLYSKEVGASASRLGGLFRVVIEKQSKHSIQKKTTLFILERLRAFKNNRGFDAAGSR